MSKKKSKKSLRWTDAEDQIVFNEIKNSPFNLSKCFIIAGAKINRTPLAVEMRWYTSISKNPQYKGFFTVSSKHLSMNRKNGMGVSIDKSLWQRLLDVIKNVKL